MPPVSRAPVKCLNLRDIVLGRLLGVTALVLVTSWSSAWAAQSVILAWNPSSGSDVAGYKVYYGTVAGNPGPPVNVGNVTTATISNLNDATTYYFSVSAYNSSGIESQRSSEISYTTPSSPPEEKYTLTVIRGSGSGSYPLGTEVPVNADPPALGEQFAYWDDDTAILKGLRTSSSNLALIIGQDVTLTAVYSYTVTVTSGTGDGNYLPDDIVPIIADAAPGGQQFAGWTGPGTVTFANASSTATTFIMPSSPVTVAATYSGSTGTPGTGLLGQYYNHSSSTAYPLANPFTGSPVLTRTDAVVDSDWGAGSPASQVTSDFFSVKWTGQVKTLGSGSYTFRVTGDDGVRLFLNGELVIDAWRDQGASSYSHTTTLTGGTLYNIELHYYEHEGDAECRLHWSYPGQAAMQAIPQSQLFSSATQGQVAAPSFSPAPGNYSSAQSVAITSATANAQIRYTTDGSTPTSSVGIVYSGPVTISNTTTLKAVAYSTGMTNSSVTSGTYTITIPTNLPGTGLLGQYYNDSSNSAYPLTNPFAGSPVLTRTDATVNFGWDEGSPASQVTSDFFSVKWIGQVKAPVSGSYTFAVTGDDGVRLFINGTRVINAWTDQGATPYTYTTTLSAGTLYNIELHYYEHEGDATCRLRWSYPGQWFQTIPQSQLYPPN